jgi:hypothetical protein
MEVKVQLHAPAALRPGEIVSRTHWIGGLVGLRAGPDAVEKNLGSAGIRTPSVHPVAIPMLLFAKEEKNKRGTTTINNYLYN